MNEICESDSFTCHKTSAPRLQCAGHMLLMGDENAFVNLANGMGVSLNLSGRDLVFDSVGEMAQHHEKTAPE